MNDFVMAGGVIDIIRKKIGFRNEAYFFVACILL